MLIGTMSRPTNSLFEKKTISKGGLALHGVANADDVRNYIFAADAIDSCIFRFMFLIAYINSTSV